MSTKRSERGKRAVSESVRAGSPTIEELVLATVAPAVNDQDSFDRDVAYYLAHLPEWHDHQGEHVLIHGAELHGFFPTRDVAMAEGFRRFGRVAFLVQRVDLDEKPRPLVGVIL